MSKQTKKPKSIETDGKLVQTRVPSEDYAAVEKMAKGSRLSMASMLRTMIASQADAYRQAQKGGSLGKLSDEEALGSLMADAVAHDEKIVGISSGPMMEISRGRRSWSGIGIYALSGSGEILAVCKASIDQHGVAEFVLIHLGATRLEEPKVSVPDGE